MCCTSQVVFNGFLEQRYNDKDGISMKADHKRRSWSKRATSSAALAALALVSTSCGGDTADGDTGGEAQGIELGAPQDEDNATTEQLEPETDTNQNPATTHPPPHTNPH